MRRIRHPERDEVNETHLLQLRHPTMTNEEARALLIALSRNHAFGLGPNLPAQQVLERMPFYADLMRREQAHRQRMETEERARRMRNEIIQRHNAMEEGDFGLLPLVLTRQRIHAMRKVSKSRKSNRR